MHSSIENILVAGTNGKGSVTTLIAGGLQAAGHRVGKFTSPHIERVTERIQVNDVEISDADLERLSDLDHPTTFFETLTAAAIRYFAEQHCDYVVWEVGLGGRLDATNVVEPILSVITSIGLDHTQILGDTLEEIAREKAGICRPGVPCILGPTAQGLGIDGIAVAPVEGDFRAENRAIAALVLQQLGIDEFPDILPPCRMEWLGQNIVLDVAHNPPAIRALLRALPDRPKQFVAAFSKGHDAQECLDLLRATGQPVHLVDIDHERMLDLAQLDTTGCQFGLPQPSDDLLVVCGSCYMMAEMKSKLGDRALLSQR
jgi:dihydrofolate synthase / folylpolyglutamate synthase